MMLNKFFILVAVLGLLASCGQKNAPPKAPSIEDGQFPQGSREQFLYQSFKDRGINNQALKQAFAAMAKFQDQIEKDQVMGVIDYTKHSGKKRFYILNLIDKSFESFVVAHGRNSDPDHNGLAQTFGDVNGSKMTSLGAFLTGSNYQGSNGLSLRLYGLEASNANAYSRAIVIHGASYVDESQSKMGRSWGCPSVSKAQNEKIIKTLENGSLLYHYAL